MGPGELFGHTSVLSGLPTGFARAQRRTPSPTASRPMRPRRSWPSPRAWLYYRSMLEDRHHLLHAPGSEVPRDRLREPVSAAIRSEPVICTPAIRSATAARRMTEAGATALIVDLGDSVGIVTDSDLRSRAVAGDLPGGAPVSAVMTAPAFTISSDRSGNDVLVEMLDRGIRHFPVVSATGQRRRRRRGPRPPGRGAELLVPLAPCHLPGVLRR